MFEFIFALAVALGAFFYWHGKKSEDMSNKIIFLDVVGESFNNDDGTSRQKIIEEHARVGDPANLKFYTCEDGVACAVSVEGRQIGHLAKEKAKEMFDLVADGAKIGAGVHNVGRSRESGLYGVGLFMEINH